MIEVRQTFIAQVLAGKILENLYCEFECEMIEVRQAFIRQVKVRKKPVNIRKWNELTSFSWKNIRKPSKFTVNSNVK